MGNSLAAEGHLSSVVSGNRRGFSSLPVLGPEEILNTIRRSERVSDSRNSHRSSRSKQERHSDDRFRVFVYIGVCDYVGTVSSRSKVCGIED